MTDIVQRLETEIGGLPATWECVTTIVDAIEEIERLQAIEVAARKWVDTDNAQAGDWDRLVEALGSDSVHSIHREEKP